MHSTPSLPPTPRTIALVDFFDWNKGGHFRFLFKLMAELLLDGGHQVLAVCQYPEEINRWAATDGKIHRDRLLAVHCPSDEQTKQRWKEDHPWEKRLMPRLFGFRRRCIRKRRSEYFDGFFDKAPRARSWKVDAIFYPSLTDYFELPVKTLPWHHIPMGGLWLTAASYINAGIAVSGGPLSTKLLNSVKFESSVRVMCFHDECLMDDFGRQFPKQAIAFFPDATDEAPANPTSHFRDEIIQRAKGRLIVATVGVMDRRKGVITLLRAAEQLPDCFFVFAGPNVNPGSFDAEERRYFEKAVSEGRENCFFRIERIADDRDFNSFVELSDVIFMAYLGFSQSSNILTKAAVFRKPVIVSDRPGCLEVRTRVFNLGIEVGEGCVKCTVKAIRTLAEQHSTGTLHAGRRYDDFVRIHSREALSKALLSVVEKLCSTAEAPQLDLTRGTTQSAEISATLPQVSPANV